MPQRRKWRRQGGEASWWPPGSVSQTNNFGSFLYPFLLGIALHMRKTAKSGYHGHHSGLSLTSWFKCAGFVKQPPENIWIIYFVKNYLGRIHPGFYFIESDWVVAHLTVSHWSPSDVFKRFFYVSMFLKSWTVLQPKQWSAFIKFLKISNLTYKDWHRCIMKVRTLKVASLLIWTSWDLKEWKPCSFPVSKPKLVPFSSI